MNNESTNDDYFVSVDETVYGPYPEALMKQYIAECRVVPQSLVSNQQHIGFQRAHMHPRLAELFSQKTATAPQQKPVLPSVFMVIADINSGQHLNFLKSLQTLGKASRLTDTVWIVAAQIDLNEMRDILSRSLTSEDRLLIHDTFSNRAGWFNIGELADQELRQLWTDIAAQRKAIKGA
jgi:hypothetical protein